MVVKLKKALVSLVFVGIVVCGLNIDSMNVRAQEEPLIPEGAMMMKKKIMG